MSMVKQFTVPWILCLCFFSLLAAKLDEVIQVSWFIIFIPMFVLDAVKLSILIGYIYQHWRNNKNPTNTTTLHKSIAFVVWLLFSLFQVLLCVFLDETIEGMRLYFAFIPIWIVLIIQAFVLNHYQLQVVQKTFDTCYCR